MAMIVFNPRRGSHGWNIGMVLLRFPNVFLILLQLLTIRWPGSCLNIILDMFDGQSWLVRMAIILFLFQVMV